MNKEVWNNSQFSIKNLLGVWLGVAVVLGALLTVSITSRNSMADVDPAYQRPGFIDLRAPFPGPRLSASIPKPGVKTVIFFSRSALDSYAFGKLMTFQNIEPRLEIVLVEQNVEQTHPGLLPIFSDSRAVIAKSYHFGRTRDGGYPSGYSVVDTHGLVRYTTIDPDFVQLLGEVGTIVEATP